MELCTWGVVAATETLGPPLAAQALGLGQESMRMQNPGVRRLRFDAPSKGLKEN